MHGGERRRRPRRSGCRGCRRGSARGRAPPRSSRSSSSRRMPSVQQTAALRGLRPVAKALGASVGRDVEARHRLAGARGQLADDAVHRRLLGLADRAGAHRAQRELVGVEVAYALTPTAMSRPIEQPGAAGDQPPPTRSKAASAPNSTAVFRPLVKLCTSGQRRAVGSRSRVAPSGAAAPPVSKPTRLSPVRSVESVRGRCGRTPSGRRRDAGRQPPAMSKNVEQLDRVVIRIAGDSGDGMQLTGDRFTQETAIFGNDLSTLPNFPAEIRAPPGTLAGRLVLPAALRRPRHPDPGRPSRRAGGDEPGGAEGQPRRPAQGRHAHRRHPRLHRRARWPGSGWTRNPLEDGTLDGFHGARARPHPAHPGRARGHRACRARTPAGSKNMFALGLLSWMYSRPTEGTLDFLRQKFANKPDIAEANITAFKAGWNFGETTEAFARLLRDQAGAAGRPARTATSPATWRWPTA